MRKRPLVFPELRVKNLTIGEKLRITEEWIVIRHKFTIGRILPLGELLHRGSTPNISWLIENVAQDDWHWSRGSADVYFRNQEDAVFYELCCI